MSTGRVEEILAGYLQRMPGAEEAAYRDAEYRLSLDLLRRILGMVDIALDDEGIRGDVRDRILRASLYGSVDDAGAALRRQERISEEIQRLRTAPPSLTAIPGG